MSCSIESKSAPSPKKWSGAWNTIQFKGHGIQSISGWQRGINFRLLNQWWSVLWAQFPMETTKPPQCQFRAEMSDSRCLKRKPRLLLGLSTVLCTMYIFIYCWFKHRKREIYWWFLDPRNCVLWMFILTTLKIRIDPEIPGIISVIYYSLICRSYLITCIDPRLPVNYSGFLLIVLVRCSEVCQFLIDVISDGWVHHTYLVRQTGCLLYTTQQRLHFLSFINYWFQQGMKYLLFAQIRWVLHDRLTGIFIRIGNLILSDFVPCQIFLFASTLPSFFLQVTLECVLVMWTSGCCKCKMFSVPQRLQWTFKQSLTNYVHGTRESSVSTAVCHAFQKDIPCCTRTGRKEIPLFLGRKIRWEMAPTSLWISQVGLDMKNWSGRRAHPTHLGECWVSTHPLKASPLLDRRNRGGGQSVCVRMLNGGCIVQRKKTCTFRQMSNF